LKTFWAFAAAALILTGCGGFHSSRGQHLDKHQSNPAAIYETNPKSFFLPETRSRLSRSKWNTAEEAAQYLRQSLSIHAEAGGLVVRTELRKPYESDVRWETEIFELYPSVKVRSRFVHAKTRKVLAEFEEAVKPRGDVKKLGEKEAGEVLKKILDEVSSKMVRETKSTFGL
jgi:hypothetical protein